MHVSLPPLNEVFVSKRLISVRDGHLFDESIRFKETVIGLTLHAFGFYEMWPDTISVLLKKAPYIASENSGHSGNCGQFSICNMTKRNELRTHHP